MIVSVKKGHPTPASRRARAKSVIESLPEDAKNRRFDLVDFREPSPAALEIGKSLEGRAKKALRRKAVA